MYSHGFLKLASASPKLKTGDVKFNVNEILKCLQEVNNKKASFAVFPEMCVTGYSVNDLLFQEYLYEEELKGIDYLLKNNEFDGVFIIGAFLKVNDALLDCALVCEKNYILGVVPKYYLESTGGKADNRYFVSGFDYPYTDIEINGEVIPFGELLFVNEDLNISFGVEVGSDMLAYAPMHDAFYANGAVMVFNPNANAFSLGNKKHLVNTINAITHKASAAYIMASNNSFESSSEVLFDNHKLISENGEVLNEEVNINTESNIIYADIDVLKLHHLRKTNSWIKNAFIHNQEMPELDVVTFELEEVSDFEFEKNIDLLPFVPKTNEECKEIIEVQATSVYKRLKHIGIEKTVIGVSGGLDSTLALLSLAYMCDKYNIDRKNIIAITMPSGNNSDVTYNNALKLMSGLGVTQREINIKEHVLHELKTIGHDAITKDVTYENAQARYRTFTLMNTANMEGGIVIGTGDMSEVALGWATFNGDQMAMYGMNAGLPKTTIKLVTKYFENIYPELKECINSVIGTPISPELKGNQLTEDIIGKYEVNDFILYHFLVNGDSGERIVYLLKKFFNMDDNQAIDYVNNFNNRFYKQQFKRLTMPEGVKILDISLSPRSELRLSGDIYKMPLEKK